MNIEKAIVIATEAHKGTKDKGGVPYIFHPLNVMLEVRKSGGSHSAQVVAVLHDVVEDTDFTMEDLKANGLSDFQATALDLVTKKKGQPYDEYIQNISDNPVASLVKLKDLEHNMDISRLKNKDNLQEKDLKRFKKYIGAHNLLSGVLNV